MNYIAVIGDLIKSRQDKDRHQTQKKLVEAFDTINQKYQGSIVSKITITLGDEFQVLIKPNKEVFRMIDEMTMRINHPVRLGIGYGPITTDINPEMSIGADGPAYWNARASLDKVKADNWNGKLFTYFTGIKSQDEIINTLLLLTDTLRSQWTESQQETFHQLLNHNIYTSSFNQKELALSLNISQSSLSKRLNSSHVKVYLKARETLTKILEEQND